MLFKKGCKPWNKGKKFPYKPNYKKRGIPAWNKGLTKETDERVRKLALSVSKARKQLSKEGKLKVWNIGIKGYSTKLKGRKFPKLSKKYKGQGNPFYGRKHTKKTKMLYSKTKKAYYIKYPEKHPNRIMAQKGFISNPQKQLFEYLKKIYPDAELEFPIKTKHSIRFADIGIPNLKLDFEYDGKYWHKDKEKDLIRDNELKEVGWETIRIKWR